MNDSNIHSKHENESSHMNAEVIDNPWSALRQYTDARIGMGRAGISLPTTEQLNLKLAHACAQDAVNQSVDWPRIEQPLLKLDIPILKVNSQVTDRQCYLKRPDLGRKLNLGSIRDLKQWRATVNDPVDVCIVISDGLSAPAIQQQTQPMRDQFIADLSVIGHQCSVICLVKQGRVAIGDEIAQILNAKFLVVLIGERPGLTAFNSLGIYFTYQARVGFTDAYRNCISNIRPKGLSFFDASRRLVWLINEANRLKLSGVQLKDDSQLDDRLSRQSNHNQDNFLIVKPVLKT